jgi:hypothetical protein
VVRRLAALGLVLGVLVGLGVLTAGPAGACSCVATRLADNYAGADVVFAGTRVDHGGGDGQVDTITMVFDVSDVLKGLAPRQARVRTASSGASCGLELGTGDRAVIFAQRKGVVLSASRCGGSAGIDTLGRLPRSTGARLTASTGSVGLPGSGVLIDTVESDRPASELWWRTGLWISFGVALGLGAAAMLVLRRLRRLS